MTTQIRNYVGRTVRTFTANGTTAVTVAAPEVTANSVFSMPTLRTVGGTVSTSAPAVRTITPGVGFTIAALAGDTSVYNIAVLS